jgi:SpoVK/Ycf46/Vps4 family AAA+-type ATPase
MFSRKKTALALDDMRTQIAALRAELETQSRLVADERAAARAVIDRLSGLEARVSGMGTELSRQIHELGNDIEQIARDAAANGLTEAVDSLRETQVRLATEQARYEITFRHDLAALADQLLRRTRQ